MTRGTEYVNTKTTGIRVYNSGSDRTICVLTPNGRQKLLKANERSLE